MNVAKYINNDLQTKLINATEALQRATAEQRAAKEAFDASLVDTMLAAGLGKYAQIEHVHAAAHHGNPSNNLTVSEVINVYATNEGHVMLRIRLGSASKKGQLTNQYASIAIGDVIRLVGARSATRYL